MRVNDPMQQPVLELSDSELLIRMQTGELKAAGEIYNRYANRLLNLTHQKSGSELTSQIEIQDIVQSVFRSFFRRASKGRYQLPEGEELWKLFLVISLNKIRKKSRYFHAAKRDVARNTAMGDQVIDQSGSPAAILRLTVDELIARIPVAHQNLIRDRILGHEVKEIAIRNQVSQRTTERVLQSFRDQLKRELEADN